MDMRFNPPGARSRQRGVSLISLLVGLTLALICAVAALHAFRATVLNTRAAAVESRSQNVAASLSLQLGKLLSQAGFGLRAAEASPGGKVNTDLVLLTGASLYGTTLSGVPATISATSQVGTGLVWATSISGTTSCYALVANSASGLVLLGPKACADAATGVTSAWTSQSTLASSEVLPSLSIQATSQDCWPFGGADLRKSVVVTVLGTRAPIPATCLLNVQS